jgi:hypothetical protein
MKAFVVFWILNYVAIGDSCPMTSLTPENHLAHFQNFGDTASLLRFVSQSGRDMPSYQEAINGLSPVFEYMSAGFQPNYKELDLDGLRRHGSEIEEILRWMADSPKANMKTVALNLMGYLGWETFRPLLEQSLSSKSQWERLTAIQSIGKVKDDWAAETLTAISADADPLVRKEVAQALSTNH